MWWHVPNFSLSISNMNLLPHIMTNCQICPHFILKKGGIREISPIEFSHHAIIMKEKDSYFGVNPGKPGWTSMSTWLLNLEWCFFYTISTDGKKPMPRCIFGRVSGFKTSVPYFSLLINIWWGGVKVKCTTLCDISEKGHVIKVGPLLYFESQNH